MEITFSVDGQSATFSRSDVTGRAELRFGQQTMLLQSPLRPKTHFDLRRRVAWHTRVGDREVEIVRTRPAMFGGLRANSFSVAVDGVVVAEAKGK
jgi:hypothetical protein